MEYNFSDKVEDLKGTILAAVLAFMQQNPDFEYELSSTEQFVIENTDDTIVTITSRGVIYELNDGEIKDTDFGNLPIGDLAYIWDAFIANKFTYSIDLDERGEFKASVSNCMDEVVYRIYDGQIFEDGFMRHTKDIDGLKKYLISMSLMPVDSKLNFEG